MRKRITCSLVGDAMVGKSNLLRCYLGKTLIDTYAPTVFSTFKDSLTVGKKQIKVKFVDTAGQQEYSRLRMLSYAKSDVIILCFSAIDRLSYERISLLWIPEIRRTVKKKVPIFLVATHKDLKSEGYVRRCTRVVSKEEGEELAEEINADGFFETSTTDSCCVKKIIECAITAVHYNRTRYLQTLKNVFFK